MMAMNAPRASSIAVRHDPEYMRFASCTISRTPACRAAYSRTRAAVSSLEWLSTTRISQDRPSSVKAATQSSSTFAMFCPSL